MSNIIITEKHGGIHVKNGDKTISIYVEPTEVRSFLWDNLTDFEDDNLPEWKFSNKDQAIEHAKNKLK